MRGRSEHVTDAEVEELLRAVHEQAKQEQAASAGDRDGWASGAAVMGRMDLQAGSILDIHNPTTDDDLYYRRVARHCMDRGLIKTTDRYRGVKLTDQGEAHIGV